MCFNFFKYIVKFNESHLFEWSKHRDALILPVFALVEKNLVSGFFFSVGICDENSDLLYMFWSLHQCCLSLVQIFY